MAFGKFGKYYPGGVDFRPATLDLIAALREDFEWAKSVDAGAHAMHFDADADRLDIVSDRTHLKYIAVNLLQNALKYSPAGSKVDLSVATCSSPASFSVTDEGIGIPQEALSQLYSPFYRAANVGERPGTGMGLAIVKRSAQLLGWRVEVDTTVHVGTRFRVFMESVGGR